MTKVRKELLAKLTSSTVEGPFVTIMLNTHVSHQDVEKDQLKFKNFCKEAKKRFEKKYPQKEWQIFQKKMDQILADGSFWRRATKSVAVILTESDLFIERLSIPVDDQYYVSDRPYLLAIIKNAQFNYTYYLLALNRDSMKLYFSRNKELKEISLPEDAPVNIKKALGEELTGGNLNYSSQGPSSEGVAYHGVNAKDEEVEIDWVNYYQAVHNFLKDYLSSEKEYPVFLFALPENQTVYKKIVKNSYLNTRVAVSISPSQLSLHDIQEESKEIINELTKLEIQEYSNLLNRKNIDQLVDIAHASKEGKISHLFIATSNLVDGFGEDPETEYDRRQELNHIASDVIQNSGEVFILDQKDSPDEKSLFAVLRY